MTTSEKAGPQTENAGPQTDPYETWRQLYDANERAWTAALEQSMGSPEYDEASGKMLETMLAAQKSVRDSMRTYLETMNVPTREDIARLGELVVGLEEKIDQVGDRLDAIDAAVRAVPAGPAGPPGPTGQPGRTGSKGPAGRVGRAGARGPAGAVGRAKPANQGKAVARTKAVERAKPATRATPAGRAKPAKGA
jgi:Poly(R)-hydroxyalkanoic acid synthase subunit (PHA_synth_III_E)/Collagen triple helix repeat (20 copies)